MDDKRVQEAKNEICKMGLGLSIEQEEALKTMVELANDKLSGKLIDKDELMGEGQIKNKIDEVFYPDCHNRSDLKGITSGQLILIRDDIASALYIAQKERTER